MARGYHGVSHGCRLRISDVLPGQDCRDVQPFGLMPSKPRRLRSPITVEDLVRVVTIHSEDEPIVPSETVRFAWWRQDLDAAEKADARRRGEVPPPYNGSSLQAADRASCRAHQLIKWKRLVGDGIGWSLPAMQPRTNEWANRKGWRQVPGRSSAMQPWTIRRYHFGWTLRLDRCFPDDRDDDPIQVTYRPSVAERRVRPARPNASAGRNTRVDAA